MADFLVSLRLARGLTQEALADLASVDRETIAKVEQRRGDWGSKRASRTPKRVLSALHETAPLSYEEASIFCRLTRLSPSVATGIAGADESARRATIDRAHATLDRLIDLIGPRRAMGVLTAAIAAAGDDPESRRITVAGAPRQTDLGVEQDFVDYEVNDQAPGDAGTTERQAGE